MEEQFGQDLQVDVEAVSDDLLDPLDHVHLLPKYHCLRSSTMAIFHHRRRKLQSDQLDGLHQCWTFFNLLRHGNHRGSFQILVIGGWSEFSKMLDDDFIDHSRAFFRVDNYHDVCSAHFQTRAG